MNFFVSCLRASFKTVRKKTFILITVFTMTVLFSMVIVCSLQNTFEKEFDTSQIKICVVNNDTVSKYASLYQSVFSIAINTKEFEKTFSINFVASEKQAEKMLDENKSAATIVLPQGFLDDIMSGKNTSPTVVVSGNQPIAAMAVDTLAKSLQEVLATAQSSIYTALDGYTLANGNYPPQKYITDINIVLATLAIGRNNIFDTNYIELAQAVTITQHYTIYTFIFFMFLSCFVFFKNFCIFENMPILVQLKTSGAQPIVFCIAQLVCIWVIYFVAFFAFSSYLVLQYSSCSILVALLPAMLSSLILVATSSVVFNLCNDISKAAATSFLLCVFWLFVSGGILPSVLLPKAITVFKYISPIYLIASLQGDILLKASTPVYILVAIIISGVLGFVFVLIANKKLQRRYKNEVF